MYRISSHSNLRKISNQGKTSLQKSFLWGNNKMNIAVKRIRKFAVCCGVVLALAVSAVLSTNTAFAGEKKYKPINKMKLVYPRRALQRGIEGYVTLQFTITSAGTVSDIEVVEAKPSKIFNKAAMKAVKKLKYEPQPADVPNVPLNTLQTKT